MASKLLENISLSTEEILGPPKMDITGVLLMTLTAFVIGFIVGITVFLLVLLSLGDFSLQSGISPILLAIITFFATIIGNYFYLWGLINIFPNIYSRSRTLAMHVSVFSILLYICMSIVYFLSYNIGLSKDIVLAIFIAHIIFNIFGLLLLTGILSLYRYSVLIIYTTVASLIISSLIPLFAFVSLGASMNILFIFMIFTALAFSVHTFLTFGILFFYYRLYSATGYDPIGSVLSLIQQDEIELEANAERVLFK